MALQKITAPPTVPEIIKFLGDVVDEFDTKLGADETAVDSNKLGGAEASAYAKLASPVFTGTPEVPTAPPGTKTDQAASTNFVQEEINSRLNGVVPVGTIIAYAANQNPEGYILCNGANVSRTTYADLFAVIGTTYGAGDGSTTFTLPNLIDRFIEGSSTAGNY
ncbi:MAG: tail fiber protein, partial [Phascolarctobacterium sp.]|nr:tail fiber protein [Phascolarctobacterium sp.]